MAHRSRTRKRKVADVLQRMDVGQKDTSALKGNGFTTLLEGVTQEILTVTYWFDPAPHPLPSPVTIRFSGHRIDAKGQLSPGDRFVQDETIEKIVPGSGPISLTVRVCNINAGEWAVTAHMLGSVPRPTYGQGNTTSAALRSALRFWRRWAPSIGSDEPVSTCLIPFARVPGIFPGIWVAMVTFGIAIALVLQFLLISAGHLKVGPWWVVSLGAIVVGIVGAKVWYIVLYRSIRGWCIQGFITTATLTATILLLVLHHVPGKVFLDVTAPGLLLAMAVGRIGCFFAGCCGGPLTASRWGIWSSDQRVGARRIPTQLLESALAGILGLLVLVAFLRHGQAGGAYFVGGLAAYTLGRQRILHLRVEPRRTKLGGVATSALATLALIAAIVLLVR
jgi:phosphatidylglycerol:prolipoprotein diacylglycerol transferase